VDQFVLPADGEFADVGSYWDALLYEAVRDGVDETNARIRQAQRTIVPKLRRLQLAQLHSPDYLARRVRWQMPPGFVLIEGAQLKLESKSVQQQFSGNVVAHTTAPGDTIYGAGSIVPDPRVLTRMFLIRRSAAKVHGTYVGLDKLGHFVGWGHFYYLQYRLSRKFGRSHEQAMQDAVTWGADNPVGEPLLHGYLTTGVFSNADLAANYVGMKFFINLTDEVTIAGEASPPIVVRDGDFWKVQDHVQVDNGYFARYMSDHFDEVLNPNQFERVMRDNVRTAIRRQAANVLDRYAGDDPARRNPAYFNQKLEQLSTYHGASYGHRGTAATLITVANTCFPKGVTKPKSVAALAQAEPAAKLERAAPVVDEEATPEPAEKPVVSLARRPVADERLPSVLVARRPPVAPAPPAPVAASVRRETPSQANPLRTAAAPDGNRWR